MEFRIWGLAVPILQRNEMGTRGPDRYSTQHQGKISISSKEAKGTVVEISIPKQPSHSKVNIPESVTEPSDIVQEEV